jgi:hypothetical protein
MENVLRMRLRVRWRAHLIDLLHNKRTKGCKLSQSRLGDQMRRWRQFVAARGAPNVEERSAVGQMRGAHRLLLALSANHAHVHV